MGGKALKNCVTTRLNVVDFQTIQHEVVDILAADANIMNIHPLLAYRTKETFGDLDVLYTTDDNLRLSTKAVQKLFPTSAEVVFNGDVVSLEYKKFQIDLVWSPKHEYGYAREYFNWNDCGNLVGRLASLFGLKHGHDGLRFPVSFQNTEKIGEIFLTRNYYNTLDFLGLSVDRYERGFDTLEDMFQWISTSKWFCPRVYALENLNHVQRIRDVKRPTYMKFLEWVNSNEFPNAISSLPPRDEMQKHIASYFAAFRDEYEALIRQFAVDKLYREVYNGHTIAAALGIPPSRVIGSVRPYLAGSILDDKELVLTMTPNTVHETIRRLVPPAVKELVQKTSSQAI